MSKADAQAVIRAVEETYGSLAEPSYGFVDDALQGRPYARLVEELSRVFEIKETTDPNDDVSFRYALSRSGDAWALDLSMVGPYGLLLRFPGEGPPVVVTGISSVRSPREADLVASIERAGVRLLSRELLEREIPLRRPAAEQASATLYHAVIGDEPLLPWQRPG